MVPPASSAPESSPTTDLQTQKKVVVTGGQSAYDGFKYIYVDPVLEILCDKNGSRFLDSDSDSPKCSSKKPSHLHTLPKWIPDSLKCTTKKVGVDSGSDSGKCSLNS